VSPSKDDIELTRRLTKAGEILGIEILDHIVISRTDFVSLKERGVM
jgi:DNA repair protein RadC